MRANKSFKKLPRPSTILNQFYRKEEIIQIVNSFVLCVEYENDNYLSFDFCNLVTIEPFFANFPKYSQMYFSGYLRETILSFPQKDPERGASISFTHLI